MHTFNSVYRLEKILEAAKIHASRLAVPILGYDVLAVPVVLISYENKLNTEEYGSIPEANVQRVHYHKKFLVAFPYGTEPYGHEGMGKYAIGMYSTEARSWNCDSILFDEDTHEPFMAKGRDMALQVAANVVRSTDKSCERRNENAILAHNLMEAPVLNAILCELMRAEPGTTPATIGIRIKKVQLLLEGDAESGMPLTVPQEGFVCRDDAAGEVLNSIVCVVNAA